MDFQLLRRKVKMKKGGGDPLTEPSSSPLPSSPPPSPPPPALEVSSPPLPSPESPPTSSPQLQAEEREVLEFLWVRLAGEDYLVPLGDVDEVVRVLPMTPVPRVSPWILGIVSLREHMIPVVALRKRLGFSGEPAGGRIVVCFSGDDRCGFLVDEVKGVVRVGKGAYQKMALGAEEGRMFLKGLVRWEGILFGELDLHKVLESDE